MKNAEQPETAYFQMLNTLYSAKMTHVLRPIQIIGGGVAGLSLGILLRKEGMPVTVFEAGQYPRHKVCGEFLSGAGIALLEQILPPCQGPISKAHATTAKFFLGNLSSKVFSLPQPALAVSRLTLDDRLAHTFSDLGGTLQCGIRWQGPFSQEGVVRATGRRLNRDDAKNSWVGVKAHATGLQLQAHLEMHFSPNGYLGLCAVAEDTVNLCALLRPTSSLPRAKRDCSGFFQSHFGRKLASRLAGAKIDASSVTTVAGVCLRRESALESSECRIGDAISTIPPLTGNGMSLGLESAWLALPELIRYSRGEQNWTVTRQMIARRCDQAFHARLLWGERLQKLLTHPAGQIALMAGASCFGTLFKILFQRTRSIS